MRHLLTRASLCIALSTATLSQAYAVERYTLDPNHTNVTWSASHFGFSSPNGKFAKVTGTLSLDEAKPELSRIEATIDTTSIITGITKFDEHLKGPDFFNAERYPTATFKSTNVEPTGETTANVTGILTLLNIAKPVVLNVTMNKIDINPFTQKKTAGFSAKTTIKRSEFGMVYGLPGVSDEVTLNFEVEAILAN